jgi:tetratricopeptide (TPR) repeat protein
MMGRARMSADQVEEAIECFDKAWAIGSDVDWFRTNLIYDLAHAGYDALVAGKNQDAAIIYRFWLRVDSSDVQPWTNMGVVLERLGKIDDAKRAYVAAAERFPKAADPVYNLGVLAWKEKNWAIAAAHFEEAVSRNPAHAQAHGFMLEARKRAERN